MSRTRILKFVLHYSYSGSRDWRLYSTVMKPPPLPLQIGATLLALFVCLPAFASPKPVAKEVPTVTVKMIDGREELVKVPLSHKTVSADGTLFAGYYRDGWEEVISIHDAATGKQLKRIIDHGDEVREFKFSPDGKILASRCVNRFRKGWALWNVETGQLIMRLADVGALDRVKVED